VGARGNSVDYVTVNEGIRDRIRLFRIGEKVDHLTLKIEIVEGGRNLNQEQEKIREEEEIEVVIFGIRRQFKSIMKEQRN